MKDIHLRMTQSKVEKQIPLSREHKSNGTREVVYTFSYTSRHLINTLLVHWGEQYFNNQYFTDIDVQK